MMFLSVFPGKDPGSHALSRTKMFQQGKAAKRGEAERRCRLPRLVLEARARQGPRDGCLTRNSFNNSPGFWRLFLDVKAKEKREKN